MSEHRVGGIGEGLRLIGGLLTSITAMIAALAPGAGAQAQVAAGRQRELDAAHASIEAAINAVESGQNQPGHHFHVANVASDIATFDIEHAVVHPHHPLDVIVDVRASAQLGGLLLSCSWFGITETFTLRIVGARGAAEITLPPRAWASQVSYAIQSVSHLTGVEADYTMTSVRLLSEEFGSGGFVAVQVLSSNHDTGPTGIYRMLPDDCLSPDPVSRIPLQSAEAHSGVLDRGQDVQALVNGRVAEGNGSSIRLWSPQLRLDMTLTENFGSHALQLGTFRAFQIIHD